MDNMAKSKRAHYWLIDFDNVGRCKYCGEVRDFGRLLRREGVFVVAGRRGAEARKEALAKKSVAAKKRWQDPKYRAKQRVAHAYQH